MIEIQCQGCGYIVEESEYRLPDGWEVGSYRTGSIGRMTFGASTGWREVKPNTITSFYCDGCVLSLNAIVDFIED